MMTKVYLDQKEYRRDSYKILSECYYLPDEGLLRRLVGLDKSRNDLYSQLANNTPVPSGIELLKVDYSKLFVGPYTLLAPPYGSVYLEDNRIMGNSTLDAKNRYADEGLSINIREAPDHIAIELEFMYYLISKEVEELINFDIAFAATYVEKQRDFLENHLGVWIPVFANKVAANAETAFYKNLARLTDSFVKEDLMVLSQTPIPV